MSKNVPPLFGPRLPFLSFATRLRPTQTKRASFAKTFAQGEKEAGFSPLSLYPPFPVSRSREPFKSFLSTFAWRGWSSGSYSGTLAKGEKEKEREGQKAFPANCALSLTEKERLRGGFPHTSLNAVMPSVFVNVGCGRVILCRAQSRWGGGKKKGFLFSDSIPSQSSFFSLPRLYPPRALEVAYVRTRRYSYMLC